jgi:hypothetical protein
MRLRKKPKLAKMYLKQALKENQYDLSALKAMTKVRLECG